MDDYSLHARPVSPTALVDAVIGLANSPRPLLSKDVESVIDMGDRYTRAVLHLGTELNLIEEVSDGYVASPPIEEDARKISPDQGFVLINQHIQRYEPFMTFLSYLDKGYDVDRSAQAVSTLYDMGVKDDVVIKQFLDLGRYAGLLSKDNKPQPNIEVETLPTAYVDELKGALESEAKARLFVQEKLGEDVVAYADHESIEKLQESLYTFKRSSDTAIVEAVVAAENITRELADDEGEPSTDYSNANGIGHLANMMRGDGIILKRHVHGANYLGSMRIPGSHGKQAETLESWHMEQEVALDVILAALDYIKSTYWFVKEQRQVL